MLIIFIKLTNIQFQKYHLSKAIIIIQVNKLPIEKNHSAKQSNE